MQYFKYKWIQYNCKQLLESLETNCKQLLESLETNYINTLNIANHLTGL